MLSLKKINEEIEKREKSDRLTNSVCQELSWLYTVRDHLDGRYGQHNNTASQMAKTQSLDLDMYPSERKVAPMTRHMAEEWMSGLKNEDGTTGPHWDFEKAETVRNQKGIDASPLEFFVTLNMMYSDYCKVAKKLGVNTVDFYACMAEAFLDDKDAIGGGGEEKLSAYYDAVVRH